MVVYFYPIGRVHISNINKIKSDCIDIFIIRDSDNAEHIKNSGTEIICVEIDNVISGIDEKPDLIILPNAQLRFNILRIVEYSIDAHVPLIALEEVLQFSLNDGKINSYLLPCDYYLLFSQNELEYAKLYGMRSQKCHVVGWPFFEKKPDKKNKNTKKLTITLFLSELSWNETGGSLESEYVREQILKKCSELDDEIYLIQIKLHPVEENSDVVKSKIKTQLPNVKFVKAGEEISHTLSCTDICLNRGNSQVSIEAIESNIPLVVIPVGINTIFSDKIPEITVNDNDNIQEVVEKASDGRYLHKAQCIINDILPLKHEDSRNELLSFLLSVNGRKKVFNVDHLIDLFLNYHLLGRISDCERIAFKFKEIDEIKEYRRFVNSEISEREFVDLLDRNSSYHHRKNILIAIWLSQQSYLKNIFLCTENVNLTLLSHLKKWPPFYNYFIFYKYINKLIILLVCIGLKEDAIKIVKSVEDQFYVKKGTKKLSLVIKYGRVGVLFYLLFKTVLKGKKIIYR